MNNILITTFFSEEHFLLICNKQFLVPQVARHMKTRSSKRPWFWLLCKSPRPVLASIPLQSPQALCCLSITRTFTKFATIVIVTPQAMQSPYNKTEKRKKKREGGRNSCVWKEGGDILILALESHCLSKSNYFIKQCETTWHSLQITCFMIITINNTSVILPL